MKGVKVEVFAILVIFAAGSVVAFGSNSGIEKHFRAYNKRVHAIMQASRVVKVPDPQRTYNAIEHVYLKEMAGYQSPVTLKLSSPAELDALFRAAHDVYFYTEKTRYLRDLQRDFSTLENRKLAKQRYYVDMYQAYLEARDVSEATDLWKRHPQVADHQPPRIVRGRGMVFDPLAPAALHWDGSMHAFQLENIDADKLRVVVVGSPLCPFTRRFVHAMEADPALTAMFKHSFWLTPQDGSNLDGDLMSIWNRKHPEAMMDPVYRAAAWPMIDDWETPTFYFLRHGRVLKKVIGWPKKGRKPALMAAMQELRAAASSPTSNP